MITGHHTNAISRRILGAKEEGETKSSGSRDESAKEASRSEENRSYEECRHQSTVKAGRSREAGGQKERSLEETGRRANWIYYRDGNAWSCTREKTKREAKKVMKRCSLTNAKMLTFAVQDYYYPLSNDNFEISNLWDTL